MEQTNMFQCIVTPGVTKIPGTSQTFQSGQANTKCSHQYHNLSEGVRVSFCDVHYEEYQKTFYPQK
jgi:hypothetical protein